MQSIESIRSAAPTRFAELLQMIRRAGTDNLSFFGGGYEKEGGYSLQQNPEEFAALVGYLEAGARQSATYLEIGTASGGVCRFLHGELRFGQVIVIDDHGHHRWPEQAEHLGAVKRSLGPEDYAAHIGDSHAQGAKDFLERVLDIQSIAEPVDIAFIDGDHTYEGITQDLALVRPYVESGTLIILHDIVACEGVKRAWHETKWYEPVAEFVGPGRPLGIGIGSVS